jgi:hypothetical protein
LSPEHLKSPQAPAEHATGGLQGAPSAQQQADAHRKAMLAESQWTPDYTDCKTPSAEEIQQLLQHSGMHENPNLKDEKDNVLYWFANTLLTDHPIAPYQHLAERMDLKTVEKALTHGS